VYTPALIETPDVGLVLIVTFHAASAAAGATAQITAASSDAIVMPRTEAPIRSRSYAL
jgi:hypothetical protein